MATEMWWERLRRDRRARGLSLANAAREFIAHSPHHADSDLETVMTAWKRWERGAVLVPRVESQQAIASMFGTAREAYFAPATTGSALARLTDDETLELVQRLRASSVDRSTLDMARITIDQLCTDYASQPGPVVLEEAERLLHELVALKSECLGYREMGEVYELTAWLTLLVACLQYDRGNERLAEQARRGAMQLASEIGHGTILGWAAEIRAWMSLTRGDYYAVIAAAREGLNATANSGVAVQLQAQEAKAWARLGNRRNVELALERGRLLLDTLPYPDNPRNHFQVDPAKFDFYAMDCYRAVGEDALAMAMAEAVAATSTTPGGEVISPMRLSEAELTRATVLARNGEVDEATDAAEIGLDRNRRSLPSLLMVGNEVALELRRLHPKSQSAIEFQQHIKLLAQPDSS
jgi:transcriptional regulator with XRE-family HTH domain